MIGIKDGNDVSEEIKDIERIENVKSKATAKPSPEDILFDKLFEEASQARETGSEEKNTTKKIDTENVETVNITPEDKENIIEEKLNKDAIPVNMQKIKDDEKLFLEKTWCEDVDGN